MSLDLSPGAFALPTIEALQAPIPDATDETRAKVLPDPTGYRLLCMIPESKETFDNSIIVKAETVRSAEEQTSNVLFVLKCGPDAYKDPEKFPTGAWCKEGDFVVVRAYAGTRFKVFGREFRLINDEQVDAVVQDPRGISRV